MRIRDDGLTRQQQETTQGYILRGKHSRHVLQPLHDTVGMSDALSEVTVIDWQRQRIPTATSSFNGIDVAEH